MAVGLLATLVGGVSLTAAPVASAAPAVVNVTVDCLGPLSVTANVGDTIVFTFASTCDFDPNFNEWNIWNLEAADGSGVNAGFLAFVSTTATFVDTATDSCDSSFENCFVPYLFTSPPAQADWTVTSNSTAGTSLTTILSAVNGSGQAIGAGVALGVLNNDMTGVGRPWAVPIIWDGPRTSGEGSEPDMTIWQQAYGRASATDACQEGYTPSWDMWPNGGTGGFVCNRFVPKYGN